MQSKPTHAFATASGAEQCASAGQQVWPASAHHCRLRQIQRQEVMAASEHSTQCVRTSGCADHADAAVRILLAAGPLLILAPAAAGRARCLAGVQPECKLVSRQAGFLRCAAASMPAAPTSQSSQFVPRTCARLLAGPQIRCWIPPERLGCVQEEDGPHGVLLV